MKNIAAKLVKVMSDCSYVQKQGKVAFGQTNYKYAQASAVLEKVNDSLVKNNLACVCMSDVVSFIEVTNARGNVEHLATVKVNITLIDSDSGETLQMCGLGSGQDNGDKAIMKAQTAAIKYAWLLTLNISTGDDPEADQSVMERMESVKSPTQLNVQTATQKPAATQVTKPQGEPIKITDSHIKSLTAKYTKEGLTTEDFTGLIKWKYNVTTMKDLLMPDFAACMNSLNIIWSEYVKHQSKAS